MTLRTESAAPPRASPSSLVRITPSSSSALLKASAEATASWPVMASQTKKTWCGLTFFSICASSAISSSSTCSRPAVSRMSVSQPCRLASTTACWQTATGFESVLAEDRHADLLADDLELLDGRRPLEVGGDEHRLAPLARQQPGQLAAGRRLARALQPAEHQDRRPGLLEPDRRIDRPHQLDQLVVDDLDDLLLGPDALDRARVPTALSVTRSMNSWTTLKLTSASSRARADLAQALLHVRFGQHAADAEAPEGGGKPFLQVVEHDNESSRPVLQGFRIDQYNGWAGWWPGMFPVRLILFQSGQRRNGPRMNTDGHGWGRNKVGAMVCLVWCWLEHLLEQGLEAEQKCPTTTPYGEAVLCFARLDAEFNYNPPLPLRAVLG